MRRRFMSSKNMGTDASVPMYIEALTDNVTVSLSTNDVEYSLDGNTWQTLSAGTTSPSINTGDCIYFKGTLTPNSSTGVGTFTISENCNVGGNVMSLLFGDDFIEQTDLTGKNYAFYKLFYNCKTIQSAKKLVLPATTLDTYCYAYMFQVCASLTQAPELPATTLAEGCYKYMFQGCISLTQAPELPVTTLAEGCYAYMFYGCTGLTQAPELPATILANNCYFRMFSGCTGLTQAPVLPATTLASYCYNGMFYNCTGLTQAPELPITILANNCYAYMFYGCTGLTQAPELPATTLAEYCYSYMFQKCTSLTQAPELPAATLVKYCYTYMFNGCKNLNYIKMLATDISASRCLFNWVSSVSSLGTFVKSKDATWSVTGQSGIPSGWTVETV